VADRTDDFEPFPKERALATAVKARHMSAFLDDQNIVGAAFGRRTAHDELTEEPAVVVYVVKKVAPDILPPSHRLPRRVFMGTDSLEVDVVETGPIYALSFTGRERPATAGISVGHTAISAGTLGCVVTDNTDGSTCILSNNHVLADSNAANMGDPIVQPGAYDGGMAPADTLATLKRFQTVMPTGNTVDCAIAQVTEAGGGVVDRVHNGLMDPPRPSHPAVGLLFAGGCNRTFINPIEDVLAGLNVSLPGGPGSTVAATVGMNVEKVGRTTEYTTSTVREVDATVTVDGYKFGSAGFDGQITTAWLSAGGDSGSVVCRGGEGGNLDRCDDCISVSAAEDILGFELKREGMEAKLVRDNFLKHTLVGRYLIEVFYLNEVRMRDRVGEMGIGEEDREHLRQLFSAHAPELRRAFLDQDDSVRLTAEHLAEARSSLARAEKFMRPDEKKAAHEALDLAQRAQGMNARTALTFLNSRDILRTVRRLAEEVEFLNTPPPDVTEH
jgi:hypothetical protein